MYTLKYNLSKQNRDTILFDVPTSNLPKWKLTVDVGQMRAVFDLGMYLHKYLREKIPQKYLKKYVRDTRPNILLLYECL